MQPIKKLDTSSQASTESCVLVPRLPRKDVRTARVIYQALLLRDAFGPCVANTYVAANRVSAALWRRILTRPTGCQRR